MSKRKPRLKEMKVGVIYHDKHGNAAELVHWCQRVRTWSIECASKRGEIGSPLKSALP